MRDGRDGDHARDPRVAPRLSLQTGTAPAPHGAGPARRGRLIRPYDQSTACVTRARSLWLQPGPRERTKWVGTRPGPPPSLSKIALLLTFHAWYGGEVQLCCSQLCWSSLKTRDLK